MQLILLKMFHGAYKFDMIHVKLIQCSMSIKVYNITYTLCQWSAGIGI